MNFDRTSEFQRVFTETTAWAAVQELGDEPTVDKRVWKRDHTLYQFDQLERLATDVHDRPRFVFAHLTIPHEPYVFEADGSFVSAEAEEARGRDENYRRQLAYANTRVLQWLDRLVSGDDATDPIVIVQADEGPHPIVRVRGGPGFRWDRASVPVLREKLRILNAMRLPGVADEDVPETDHPGQHVPVRAVALLRRGPPAPPGPDLPVPGRGPPLPLHRHHRRGPLSPPAPPPAG